MSRLTVCDEFGNADIIGVDSQDLQLNLEFKEFNKVTEALNRLAHYEDLAEKGLLVELPCKVGDTVYKIPSKAIHGINIVNGHAENNRVYAQKVSKIEFYPSGYLLKTCDGLDCVIEQLFNESWFLTESEAEQALADMK